MEYILLVFLVISTLLLAFFLFRKKISNTSVIETVFKVELQKEFLLNRDELSRNLKENRNEFTQNFERLNETLLKKAKDDREELRRTLKDFETSFSKSVESFNTTQKEKFDQMKLKQEEMIKTTELRLERMRETVDEKLHKTLEERLGKSFDSVSKQLLEVQKGLGEMQSIASGVGDLKRVLTNVKTRGVLGEIQLGNILEEIMSRDQYETNVKTKKGSDAIVEFAIKLPGRNVNDSPVFLPIDAKFPQEDYARLQTAYEAGDSVAVEQSMKALLLAIKKFAKDIANKYIDPPNTTDFGIMFLPIEGLFAEVIRQPDMITFLQREYKIVITGPTTLAAMLNSLQMGFKTLAIQKRSSEVWNVLASVKKEFNTFGGVLEKAQKKINEANNEIENLVGTRTRMMQSKLKNVEQLELPDKVIEKKNLLNYNEDET
ncbi:DNA recombination protein RmuC [Flavobacteriaceae bacterium]|jgi:DNA recombination protein RmuC|nr:DNA recombination protein RmuC [Flavobacteriaceae bacterium]MDB4063105.1 DNA recombination protein RmuC [Flavobacteriaceae bacterium]MDC0001248.1 DNA recombination protein RmuC [Flavobacteriaceae bacterium]